MCIHQRSEERGVLSAFRTWQPEHAWAVVRMMHPNGDYGQGYPVKADNTQDIANRVRDIQAWHEDSGATVVDLSHVNEVRVAIGLWELNTDGLPAATGAVPKSEDLAVA